MRLFTPLAAAALLLASPAVLAQSAKTAPAAPPPPSSALAPPANDNFANATVISGSGESLSSTIDATLESGEPTVPAACATGDSGQSVWFTFTAGTTGPATFDTNGSIVATPPGPAGQFTDTIMSLYSGSAINALTQVACNDDDPTNTAAGDFTSRIVTAVTAGTRYYVRVSSFFGGNRQNGEVRLTYTGLGTTTATEGGAQAAGRLVVMPNPAVSEGRVSLAVATTTANARVALYDMLGREVRVLYTGAVAAGQEEVIAFRTAGLPAGAYVVRATGEGLSLTQRVTVAH